MAGRKGKGTDVGVTAKNKKWIIRQIWIAYFFKVRRIGNSSNFPIFRDIFFKKISHSSYIFIIHLL
jgi:hypothetical protein